MRDRAAAGDSDTDHFARQFIDQSDPVLARLSTKFALQAGGVGRSVSWRDWLGLVRRSIR